MKPRHSTSLLLVWRVAELEARQFRQTFLARSGVVNPRRNCRVALS
jgi:hypothetical protein